MTADEQHDKAVNFLALLAPEALKVSRWCEVEAASAIAAKVRRGDLPANLLQRVVHELRSTLADTFTFVAVADLDFERALSLMASCTEPLRGADALHLAIAERHRASVWTFDKGMAKAGQTLALDTRLLD